MGAMRLAGKTALVTGAASGIGNAVTLAFLREGATVLAADVKYLAGASGSVDARRILHLDVTSESDWQNIQLPRLDVMVACAGISDARPILELDLEEWRRVLQVNLDGAFLSLKFAARAMQEQGGAIVIVGSASGIKAAPGASAYCASKAGVSMLAKTAALELKSRGIRVNCVSPAGVVTPMWKGTPLWSKLVDQTGSEAGAWKALGGADPSAPSLQRMAMPEEIADAIVFFSCDESAHITGTDLVVDAGYTL